MLELVSRDLETMSNTRKSSAAVIPLVATISRVFPRLLLFISLSHGAYGWFRLK